MQLLPRHSKRARDGDHSYFGEYGEVDLAISLVRNAPVGHVHDSRHYHKQGREYYVVIDGEMIIEVAGEPVHVTPDHALLVEPNEVHRVVEVVRGPATSLALATVKDPLDKVVLPDVE